MELAATFFYVSAGLAIWVLGALLAVILVELIKTLKAFQQTADNFKSSLLNLESWRSAIASAFSSAVSHLISKKGGEKN